MASLLEDVITTGAASPQLLATFKDPRAYTAMIVDEPARWFYEESDQENWDQREEFRNIAPPFEQIWMEFKAPKFIRSEVYGLVPWHHDAWRRAGVFLKAYENHPDTSRFVNARWLVEAEIFIEDDVTIRGLMEKSMYHGALDIIKRQFGKVDQRLAHQEATDAAQREMAKVPKIMNFLKATFAVEADGKLALTTDGNAFMTEQSDTSVDWFNLSPEGQRLLADGLIPVINVALLSLYMMHAAGTELKSKQVPQKLKKAREKKRKTALPEIRFKVLDLGLGMRQSLKEAKAEGKGLSRALHLRRGHFKTFTKPMFGRPGGKTGDVWIRPHRVGDKEEGEIIKKYRLKKPGEESGDKPASRNPDSLVQESMRGAYRGARPRQTAPVNLSGGSGSMGREELIARLMEAYRASGDDPEGRAAIMQRIRRLSGHRENPGYCDCD